MALEVNDQFRPASDVTFLEKVVSTVLNHVQQPEMEVSLLLTDDAGISQIHDQFMGDPTPTDVISFAMDGDADLVVSVECANRVAAQRGHAAQAELALYVIHGILHVCGFDDIESQDRLAMREQETAVMQQLGLQVSPVDDCMQ